MAPRRPPLGGENPNTDIRQQRRRGEPPPPPEDDDRGDGRGDDRGYDDPPQNTASRRYRTGNDYPAQERERDRDQDLAPSEDPPDLGDRDIYGEDDPLPDDPEMEQARESGEDNPDATRAGPPRKLVVVSGPDKGKVKRFSGVRLVVGRTSSCNVHLSDNSVSRRHLELVQGSNGVLLRDLGSGNGTKVNGERVNEKVLQHEDVIEIGQTKLQFIDEAEAIRLMREEAERREEEEKRKREEDEAKAKAEAEEKAKAEEEAKAKAAAGEAEGAAKPEGEGEGEKAEGEKAAEAPEKGPKGQVKRAFRGLDWKAKIGLGLAGGAVLFVMFLLIPALFKPAPPPPPPAKQVAAAKKMDQARMALGEERFEDAANLAEQAERIWPGIDTDAVGPRARQELAAIKGLAEARAFLDQQRFEEARMALAQVPDVSPKRVEEKHKLEAELEERQIESMIKAINEALQATDVESARQLIEQLPEERRADFAKPLAEAEKRAKEMEKEDRQRAQREAEEDRRRRKAARQAQIDAAFQAVERKLNSGDFDRAILECDRVADDTSDNEIRQRAIEVKRLIPAFQRAWEDGDRKFRSGGVESSVRSLRKAKDLYRQIRLGGALGARLDDELLEALVTGGKAALLRNDLASAATLYREALQLSPNDDAARAGLGRVADKADTLYQEAYMVRDRDPKECVSKLKLVMEIAPKTSAAYEKAKALLATRAPEP